eukprot:XP_024998425.1 uncharacterized protein LOC112530148 [Gallus gallus]
MRPRALLTRFLIVKLGPMGEALSSVSAATAWPRRGTAAGAAALNGAPDPPESPRCPAEHHRARPELRRAPLCCLRSGPPVSMVIGPPERIERQWSCSALAALRRQSANSMAFGPPGGTTHARREAEVAGLNCNGSPRRVRRSSVLLVVRAVVNDGLTISNTSSGFLDSQCLWEGCPGNDDQNWEHLPHSSMMEMAVGLAAVAWAQRWSVGWDG